MINGVHILTVTAISVSKQFKSLADDVGINIKNNSIFSNPFSEVSAL
jgi:hypothetical protein